jgi:hypothetical protein
MIDPMPRGSRPGIDDRLYAVNGGWSDCDARVGDKLLLNGEWVTLTDRSRRAYGCLRLYVRRPDGRSWFSDGPGKLRLCLPIGAHEVIEDPAKLRRRAARLREVADRWPIATAGDDEPWVGHALAMAARRVADGLDGREYLLGEALQFEAVAEVAEAERSAALDPVRP